MCKAKFDRHGLSRAASTPCLAGPLSHFKHLKNKSIFSTSIIRKKDVYSLLLNARSLRRKKKLRVFFKRCLLCRPPFKKNRFLGCLSTLFLQPEVVLKSSGRWMCWESSRQKKGLCANKCDSTKKPRVERTEDVNKQMTEVQVATHTHIGFAKQTHRAALASHTKFHK